MGDPPYINSEQESGLRIAIFIQVRKCNQQVYYNLREASCAYITLVSTSSIARFCYSGRGLRSLPQMGMVV